jgi:hypothetical protein
MKYSGSGYYELEPDEERELEAFYDDPEQWLWENNAINTAERKALWTAWFQELRFEDKEDRLTWKQCLVYVYEAYVRSLIIRDAPVPMFEKERDRNG